MPDYSIPGMDGSTGGAASGGSSSGLFGGMDFTKLFNFNANGSSASNPSTPGASSILGGNTGLGSGLGMNIGTGQLALGGLNTIGQLWTAWNAMDLAKKQFDFQKQYSSTNLNNQVQSYDTALADRANTRAFTEGLPQSSADAYVAANKLKGI